MLKAKLTSFNSFKSWLRTYKWSFYQSPTICSNFHVGSVNLSMLILSSKVISDQLSVIKLSSFHIPTLNEIGITLMFINRFLLWNWKNIQLKSFSIFSKRVRTLIFFFNFFFFLVNTFYFVYLCLWIKMKNILSNYKVKPYFWTKISLKKIIFCFDSPFILFWQALVISEKLDLVSSNFSNKLYFKTSKLKKVSYI